MLSQRNPEHGRSTADLKRDLQKPTVRNQVSPGQFQVLGANLQIVIDGFGSFTLIANRILLEEGLGADDGTGAVKFEPSAWYPLELWLKTLERIGNEFGHVLLFQSGMTTPKNAIFPPTVTDIHSALKCIDIAYHMNHAMRGETMFSPNTGEMRDGIGHYSYAHTPGKNLVTMESSTPYPCDFDRGIIIAMAQRFQPTATILHDATKPCRKRGGGSCAYHVAWK
ncbi:hypothetical protein [Archangium lansingense]|uniref:Uncharacterized protein n=1 Tax=Archangium lansingense TaxID=2995310 RepID=A0ABT4AE29_9BACT|nr:hypothetical protein [Archangium lansinium]MCY1079177.1 hypothetical protein [Archangium lansinium]